MEKAQSPAILFYTSDFLSQTYLMSDEDVGKYIKIICMFHQKGYLSKQELEIITKGKASDSIMCLLKFDENRGYYSEWLDEIVKKRNKYSEKQRENVLKRWKKQELENTKVIPELYQSDTKMIQGGKSLVSSLVIHLENENENENINVIKNIIDYLNNKINANYKYNSKITKEKIIARMNEGFTDNDFYTVIDKKYNHWFKDKKMREFLRPATLFGTKFESYLNAPSDKSSLKEVDIDISEMFSEEK